MFRGGANRGNNNNNNRRGAARAAVVISNTRARDNVFTFIHDRRKIRTAEDSLSLLDSLERIIDFSASHVFKTKDVNQLLHDKLKPRGIRDCDIGKNLITDAGLEQRGNLFLGKNANYPTHCAVGTDNTAPEASDNALGAEVDRVAITSTKQVANVSHMNTFFDFAQGIGALEEVGILTSAVGGILIGRRVFTATKNKTVNDTMTIKYTITETAAT